MTDRRRDPDQSGTTLDDAHQEFTAFYRRHATAVWNHAYRLTMSSTAAEDIAAATFLVAWRRRDEVCVAQGSERAWLLAVASNEARTEWRRSVRHQRVSDRLGCAPDVDDHSEAVAGSVDDRARVHRVLAAIQDLPAAQREAVSLCWVGGVSQIDAARTLGITHVTLRLRIHRARVRLAALFSEEAR